MNHAQFLATSALALGLLGCQTMGTPSSTPMGERPTDYGIEQTVRQGTIIRIDTVSLEGDNQLGLGAVLGGAAGGLLGHQIGSGTGQDVATVLGVIGGAVAGNVLQRKYADQRVGQNITVRLDNGVSVVVTQEADNTLAVGDRVRIEGAGQTARVRRR